MPGASERAAGPWLIRLLALGGALNSAYLLSVSVGGAGLPLGCGSGSGCSEVLGSRWGGTLGIPVSGPALLVWLTALGASVFLGANRSAQMRGRAWNALLLASGCAALAAIWFIVLQLLVIRAMCPWCMAGHLIAIIFAAVVWRGAPAEPRRPVRAVIAGLSVVAVASLVSGQILVEYSPASLRRLPAGQDADTGPGPHRVVQLIDGELLLRPHEEPTLGSPDAEHVLVLLFDYCCPHCRATHGYLLEAMERSRGQLAILPLPAPRDRACNPSIEETEPRFEHACELAQLALAVHLAEPTAFEAFDRWLFEPEMPRTPEEARGWARGLVGAAELEGALIDSRVEGTVARGLAAYAALGAERIPVILAVGMETIEGRPGSAEELFGLLEAELHVQGLLP